jgi:hypothetical protein
LRLKPVEDGVGKLEQADSANLPIDDRGASWIFLDLPQSEVKLLDELAAQPWPLAGIPVGDRDDLRDGL